MVDEVEKRKSGDCSIIITDIKLELTNVVFGIQSHRPIGGDKLAFLRCVLFSDYYTEEVGHRKISSTLPL